MGKLTRAGPRLLLRVQMRSGRVCVEIEAIERPKGLIGRARYELYRVMFETPNAPKIHHYFDRFIMTLIVMSVIAILLEHHDAIHEEFHWEFALFDRISVIIFTFEYVGRMLCGGLSPKFKNKRFGTLSYAMTPMAILDFLVVVPFYLTFIIELDLRFLRILRLLRILKLMRFILPAWQEFCVMGPDHIDRHLEDLAPAKNWLGRVRNYVYRIMFETPNAPKIHYIVDQFIIGLIVASVIAIILEHVEAIHEIYHEEFALFDQVSVVIFTAEYALRLFCADLNPIYKGMKWKLLRYMLTPMALLDFFVVVPFYLTFIIDLDLRFLRVLRLLRIFKLARFLVPKWLEFKELNRNRTFRQQLYSMLNEDQYSGEIQHIIDVALVGLIFFSVVAVVLESVEEIHSVMEFEFHYFDRFSVFVFSTEYLLRVFTAVENPNTPKPITGRLRYMAGPAQIIDLLSVLPFYLTLFIQIDLRFLRVMRLLRILKLTRYSTAMTTVIEVITEELPSLGAALFVLMLITIFSASLMYLVEHEAQPDKFTSIPEAMYWAIITLTSIGYGDVYPVTPLGQFLTMIMACVGLGMIALPTGILATGFNEKLRKRAEAFKELVEEKAKDGIITEDEQKELNKKATEMGLSKARERQFEEEAIKGLVRAAAPVPGLAVTFEADEHIDTIFRMIEPLNLRHKSILLARLAISLPSHSIIVEAPPVPKPE